LTWLARKPRSESARLLICFPHAGAGAAAYRDWGSDQELEVLPVRLPGRESRLGESPRRRMDALAIELAAGLAPVLDRDFAFYGHSMGAVLAFEVSRALRDRYGKCPGALFVAASPPPGAQRDLAGVTRLSDEELVAVLTARFGAANQVLAHPELMKLLLPAMRADLEMLTTHRFAPGPPLPCPIVGFYGDEDVLNDREVLARWQPLTAGAFSLEEVAGGHFFVIDQAQLVLARLREHLAVPASKASHR
jgi:medium-chain acyl-[acyl-carrier-protein] hydrolase